MGERRYKDTDELQLFCLSKGYEYKMTDGVVLFDVSQLEEGEEVSEFLEILIKDIPDG